MSITPHELHYTGLREWRIAGNRTKTVWRYLNRRSRLFAMFSRSNRESSPYDSGPTIAIGRPEFETTSTEFSTADDVIVKHFFRIFEYRIVPVDRVYYGYFFRFSMVFSKRSRVLLPARRSPCTRVFIIVISFVRPAAMLPPRFSLVSANHARPTTRVGHAIVDTRDRYCVRVHRTRLFRSKTNNLRRLPKKGSGGFPGYRHCF